MNVWVEQDGEYIKSDLDIQKLQINEKGLLLSDVWFKYKSTPKYTWQKHKNKSTSIVITYEEELRKIVRKTKVMRRGTNHSWLYQEVVLHNIERIWKKWDMKRKEKEKSENRTSTGKETMGTDEKVKRK